MQARAEKAREQEKQGKDRAKEEGVLWHDRNIQYLQKDLARARKEGQRIQDEIQPVSKKKKRASMKSYKPSTTNSAVVRERVHYRSTQRNGSCRPRGSHQERTELRDELAELEKFDADTQAEIEAMQAPKADSNVQAIRELLKSPG